MINEQLELAWQRREPLRVNSQAIRVLHGPSEIEDTDLQDYAIEVFGNHAWIFEWAGHFPHNEVTLQTITDFLKSKDVQSAVYLLRPGKGEAPQEPRVLWGTPPDYLDITEFGLKYRIRFLKTKHPGLFLDHAPLREWLMANVKGLKVLNTFAYTGSLSVAAASGEKGRGGASQVLTLDLSKPIIDWAKENWAINNLTAEQGDFIFGETMEWLTKFDKRDRRFDVVILDPPSFSRSPKGVFSVERNALELHEKALKVLNPGGYLITSINSEKMTPGDFRKKIEIAAHHEGRKLKQISDLRAPDLSFPGARHLKGFIFQT